MNADVKLQESASGSDRLCFFVVYFLAVHGLFCVVGHKKGKGKVVEQVWSLLAVINFLSL